MVRVRPHRLVSRQLLPLDLETVFAFFADAANLDRLTPPWLHFQILSQLPIVMSTGTRIDYKLKLRGVPLYWQSEITVWNPPYTFQDVQRRGPYLLWEHTHRFEAVRQGATIVTDEVSYRVPGGSVINALLVRPDLERIFRYRRERLEEWAIATLTGDRSRPGVQASPSRPAP